MTQHGHELVFASQQERATQYNARASVADFDACVREYTRLADIAKRECAGIYDLHYGQGAAERLDIFPAMHHQQPAPLFVFIHGGYWHSQAKDDAPIMAKAFTNAGIAVCTLEYTLLPEATLAETVREVRSAVSWLYHNAAAYGVDRNRIHVGGSSAGGHLAAMLGAAGWQGQYQLPDDAVKGVLSLSGLYDLRPLCDIYVNEWLQLHPEQAQRLSPLFQLPAQDVPVVLAVGGLETDGFKNQTYSYEAACREKGLNVRRVETPHCNHFDLLCELCDPDSDLSQATFDMVLQRG
ncbi:MAG TPA: alpha/beta hydrolase [Eoetvoesiella sp.]|uniref:alpha/beta hydrolase n=1 Tax=Eoetvoesiella sp. TaxID=1966355 RepID=UPI002C25A594|nr:alpha/beta hydrolase [Eoetvoesiella sp.]HWK61336.1 alpha/beta hydrolase [Eoetvoesiella sp.]